MAGVGAYPPVIQLPKDTRWADLGKGIGDLGKSIFDAWNTTDATQKANQMVGPDGLPDLDKQMVYLQSRLGEKGGKLIDQRMNLLKARQEIEASKASVARDQAAIHSATILDKLHEVQANDQAALDRAKIASENASAMASRAAAGGSSAMVQLHLAEKDKVNAEITQIEERQRSAKQSEELITGLLKKRLSGGTPDATQPPTVQPQSYERPDDETGGRPPIRPISSSDIIVPTSGAPAGTTGGTTGGVGQPSTAPAGGGFDTKKILDFQSLYEGGKLSTKDIQPPPISETLAAEVLAHMGSGTPEGNAKALEALQKGDVPSKTEKQELIPGSGIKVEMGLYSDGKWHQVPGGEIEDTRKPTSEVGKRAGAGAVLWYGTSQALRALGSMDVPADSKTSDALGGRGTRQLNSWLVAHGFSPIGDHMAEDFEAIRQHAMVGISGLMAGLRQTNALRKQMDETLPRMTDSVAIRNAKIRATELTADLMIKEEVESSVASHEAIDPGLRQLYMQKQLYKADVTQMRTDYLNSVKAAHVSDNPVDIRAKGEGDGDDTGTASGGGGTPPAARGGGKRRAVTIPGLPAGVTVEEVQ